MNRRRIGLALGIVFGVVTFASSGAQPSARVEPQTFVPTSTSGVVAHEWGTFTTVADEQGNATEWLPLSGDHDLPCFVDYFDNRQVKVLGVGYGAIVNYEQARSRMRGTVRMETPVIYFYSDRDATVDVTVKFPSGLFSEWYPAATVFQMGTYENLLVKTKTVSSQMKWKNVRIEPSAVERLPRDERSSHYYAARQTDANPVRVGDEQEKFLFYRGIGGFAVPVSATLAEEDSVVVKNLGRAPLPGVVLFSRQGTRASFRIFGTLDREITLNTSPSNNNLAELKQYLHKTLVETGLYPREAQAMLETWGDSWFEEGTRVFYIVPPATVDEILPLAISPQPVSTVRAFVGRVEVITPEMEHEVAQAFAVNDVAALTRYGRLIGPIGDRLMAKAASPAARARISERLTERLKAFVSRSGGC